MLPGLFPRPGPGCEDTPLYLEVQFHCGANTTREASRETEGDKEDKIGNMGENISKVTHQTYPLELSVNQNYILGLVATR